MPTVVTSARVLKDITPFLHLVPKPTGRDEVVKRNADLKDTLNFLPKAIYSTLDQTREIALKLFKSDSIYETCRRLHRFMVERIFYQKDEDLIEQIRSPSRFIHDHKSGKSPRTGTGDCDCATVFTSSCLLNLHIPHTLRTIKLNEENGFQHIYVIVPSEHGKYFTIDFVIDEFNEESPYIEKIDKKMELHFLNGLDTSNKMAFDAEDVYEDMDLEGLGKIKIFQKAGQAIKTAAQKTGQAIKTAAQKTGQAIKKPLHAINKINPAAVLLRTGVLAAMKLNLFKVAEKLRYAYLTDAQAQGKGMNMDRFGKLKKVREKLEKIFFGAGGKPENLRNAILTGKGNDDKAVALAGLGYVRGSVPPSITQEISLKDLLGEELYYSENVSPQGIAGLGEVATGTAVAAASGMLAAIAAILKGIGDLFGKKKEGESSELDTSSVDASVPSDSSMPSDAGMPDMTDMDTIPTESTSEEEGTGTEAMRDSSGSQTPTTTNTTTPTGKGENSFTKAWDWVKENPIKTAGYALLGAGVITGSVLLYKHFKKKEVSTKAEAVQGLPRSRKKKKNKKAESLKVERIRE